MSRKAGDDTTRVEHALDRLRSSVTATVSFIAAALGVIFLLVPSIRPLSRDKIEASVEVPTVELGVSVRRWAQRQYGHDRAMKELRKLLGPDGIQSTYILKSLGTVVYVRLRADGFKHRKIQLRARLYDAKTRVPIPPSDVGEQLYPRAGKLSLDAPSRASVQLILISNLTDLNPAFVRVEAYDEHGILAYGDSPKITIPPHRPRHGRLAGARRRDGPR